MSHRSWVPEGRNIGSGENAGIEFSNDLWLNLSRCLTRNIEGLDIYGPASFPQVPIELEEIVNPTLPDIPADESNEVPFSFSLRFFAAANSTALLVAQDSDVRQNSAISLDFFI